MNHEKNRSVLMAAVLAFSLLASCGFENSAAIDTEFVKLTEHVSPEMYSADYWGRKDEKPWSSLVKIKEINTLNENAVDVNGKMYSLTELDEKLTADKLRAVLQTPLDIILDRSGFLHGKPIDSEYWQELIENSNIDGIPDKLNILKKLTTGTMLYIPGHVMLYLGMKDKRPYVISAVSGFCPESLEVGTVQDINTVVINDLYIRRRNSTSWLDNLNCAVVFR